MMNMTKAMIQMGNFYERLYRIPVLGDRVVRQLNQGIAFLTFHNPFLKMKSHRSIQGVKEEMLKLSNLSSGKFEIVREDETSFEYLSSPCPYGFNRKAQKGVCDAAMDMNRHLISLCGGELTIHDSISSGAPQCRISIRMKATLPHTL